MAGAGGSDCVSALCFGARECISWRLTASFSSIPVLNARLGACALVSPEAWKGFMGSFAREIGMTAFGDVRVLDPCKESFARKLWKISSRDVRVLDVSK